MATGAADEGTPRSVGVSTVSNPDLVVRLTTMQAASVLRHDEERDTWWVKHWRQWGIHEDSVIEVTSPEGESVLLEVRVYDPASDHWLLKVIVVPDTVPTSW
jgi:hypothetical protein